jgi:hypothetical protein
MKSIWLIFRDVSFLSFMKRCFPLIILVIFTVTGIAALNGLARNIAQKRDFFSDPLCAKALWKKTYHAGHDLPQATTPLGKNKTAKGRKSV